MKKNEGVPQHPNSSMVMPESELQQLNLELRQFIAELLIEKSENLQELVKLNSKLSEQIAVIGKLETQVKILEKINNLSGGDHVR